MGIKPNSLDICLLIGESHLKAGLGFIPEFLPKWYFVRYLTLRDIKIILWLNKMQSNIGRISQQA